MVVGEQAYGLAESLFKYADGESSVVVLLARAGAGAGHHTTIATGLGGGRLTARRAGMEHVAVAVGHGAVRRGLPLEKSPIEGLFGPRRLGLQAVEHLLIEEDLRTFRHRAFLDDVVDAVEHGVRRNLAFGQAVQRLDLLREALHRRRQA